MPKFYKKILLLVLAALGLFCAAAQCAEMPPPARVRDVKACLAEKEAAFGTTPMLENESTGQTLKNINGDLAAIDKMIGCADEGLKIKNLNWHLRRAWLIKKFEYYQMRQVFTQYACYFGNLMRADALTQATLREIDGGNKSGALRRVNKLKKAALETRACADRAARFRHIEPEAREGFQELSAKTDKLLANVASLRAAIRKMSK